MKEWQSHLEKNLKQQRRGRNNTEQKPTNRFSLVENPFCRSRHYTVTIYNLHTEVNHITKLESFKKHLNTLFFNLANNYHTTHSVIIILCRFSSNFSIVFNFYFNLIIILFHILLLLSSCT